MVCVQHQIQGEDVADHDTEDHRYLVTGSDVAPNVPRGDLYEVHWNEADGDATVATNDEAPGEQ